jgi:hypothetical protein
MTTVKILTESQGEGVKKPIEFVKKLLDNGSISEVNENDAPSKWQVVTLLQMDYTVTGYDLMFANSVAPFEGCLYLGHFNDGIVL